MTQVPPFKPFVPFDYTRPRKTRYVWLHISQDEVNRCESPEEMESLRLKEAHLQMISHRNGWVNPWEHIPPDYFDGYTDDQIRETLIRNKADKKALKEARRAIVAAAKEAAKAQAHAARWKRPDFLLDRYEVIDGRLHEVRESRSSTGQVFREVSPNPVRSNTIMMGRERMTVSNVIALLTTGVPVRMGRPIGSTKGPRYKAQIRLGDKVQHLGMFDSPEERDAAVMSYRLGLTP